MNAENRLQHVSPVIVVVLAVVLMAARSIAQVSLVKDINPGVEGSSGGNGAMAFGSKILFNANDGTHGSESWVSDGTTERTFMLTDIVVASNPQGYCGDASNPVNFIKVGDGANFSAIDFWDETNPSNPFCRESDWITDDEITEAADVLGPTEGWEGETYEYTFDATTSKDHQLEYSISWGDGDSTDWAVLSGDPLSVTASHAWIESGQKLVTFTVRCVDHPQFDDFSYVYADITPEPDEVISTPVVTGQTSGVAGTEYTFTLSATSNLGHDLEYLVSWGDGSDTGWTAFGEGVTSVGLSHTWGHADPDPFPVDAEIRCVDHQIGSPTGGTTIEINDVPEGWIFGDGFESGGGVQWSSSFGMAP